MTRRALHLAAIIALTLGVVTGVAGWAGREPLASTAELLAMLRAGQSCYLYQVPTGTTAAGIRSRSVKRPTAVVAAIARLPADARFVRRPGRGNQWNWSPGDVSANFYDGDSFSLVVGDRGATAHVGNVTYDIRGVPAATLADIHAALAAEAAKP